MKKSKTFLLLIIILVIGIMSCVKERISLGKEEIEIHSEFAESKKWYNAEIAKAKNQNTPHIPILGISKINWDKGVVYYDEKTMIVSTGFQNKYFKKYLKVTFEKNGITKNETFLYIYFAANSNLKILNFKIEESFILKQNIIDDFIGTVLEYDLSYKLLSSKSYTRGIENEKFIHKIDYKFSTPNKISNGSTIYTSRCIDWYWNTYVNGVVVESVYAFTTCDNNDESIDPEGGDGGNGDGPDPCIAAVALGESFINAGHSVDGGSQILGAPPTDNDNWTVPYNWIIFTAGTWGLISYENATLNKVHYPNYSRWEFQSMSHTSIQHTGINLGGTRTYAYINSNFNLTPTHQTIWNRIDFSVSSTAATIAGCSPLPTLTQLYNANTIHYAP